MKKILTLLFLLTSFAAIGQDRPLTVGLFEDTGNTWMKNSGVKWDYRYRYLTLGWSNNWNNGPKDGSFAARFFQETDSMGFIPAIAYYEAFDLPPSGTGTYAKLKLSASQKQYFEDFKLLMVQAKAFGKPVLVLVEPDTTGYLQGELKGANLTPDTAYAAIKDSGVPELSKLPNTVAGWGQAFLAIRDAVGANNVKLGLHVSGWAAGSDILYGNGQGYIGSSPSLQDAVNATSAFLMRLGMDRYDVLVTDPLDRDADYYRIARNEDRWFASSDVADVSTMSFNRYATWLDIFHAKSQKPWIMWQIPIGNSNSPNNCTKGYKSNHTEYFFGTGGSAHRAKFAAVGVTTLLFGEGASCQTTRQTDGDYLKANAGAYLNGTVTPPTTNPPVVDAGTVTPPTAPTNPPVVTGPQYDFEGSSQGWKIQGNKNVIALSAPTNDTSQTGSQSLGMNLGMVVGTQQVLVANPNIPPGSTVSFSVIYTDSTASNLVSIQVFAQESAATQWRWDAAWRDIKTLSANKWNVITIKIPADASAIQSLGIEITTKGSAYGTVYLDSVGWNGSVVIQPDAGTVTPPVNPPVVDAGTPPVTVPDAGTPPVTPIGSTIKIQTIGDSITESVNSSWRCGMASLLKAQGISAQFVGTLTHPYSSCPEGKLHDGHAGWTAEDLGKATAAPAWIKAQQPDMVIWNAGANTGLWWTAETGAVAGARHEKFINDMFAAKPNIKMIVWTCGKYTSRIVPPNSQNSDTWFNQYNDQIRAIVAKLKAQGKAITLVDMATVIIPAMTSDGVHPTEVTGKTIMAPQFVQGVLQFQ